MKKFRIEITEDELKAIIKYYANKLALGYGDDLSTDISYRIHDLTKRLKKDFELSNDPRPNIKSEENIANEQEDSKITDPWQSLPS